MFVKNNIFLVNMLFVIALCLFTTTRGSPIPQLPILNLSSIAQTDFNTFDPNVMLGSVNKIRSEYGLKPLSLSSQLTEAARVHSIDQLNSKSVSHMGSDGSSPQSRASKNGYPSQLVAENVAQSQSGFIKAVLDMWMNSSGHKENILNTEYTQFGAGEANGYWTQMFGA